MQFILKDEQGRTTRIGTMILNEEKLPTLVMWGKELYRVSSKNTTGGKIDEPTRVVIEYDRWSPKEILDLDQIDKVHIVTSAPPEAPKDDVMGAKKQTSAHVSSVGSLLMRMDDDEMRVAAIDPSTLPKDWDGEVRLHPQFCENVRSVSASAVSQDERKGQV